MANKPEPEILPPESEDERFDLFVFLMMAEVMAISRICDEIERGEGN